MKQDNKYPAKVLLFGEHTILRGSQALAIPLWQRYSSWQKEGGELYQQASLIQLAEYLDQELPYLFHTNTLRADLAKGYHLASNIPTGYGMGSSGAVCVAVFDRYATATAKRQLTLHGPKAFLAKMEGFFHGSSSGTDPLIIYLQESIALAPNGQFETVELPALKDNWQFFLLDTEHARQTAPLVRYFTDRYDTDRAFASQVDQQWIPPTNNAIDALRDQNMLSLVLAFRQISQFQFNELPPMVLDSIRPIWEQGLQSGNYYLKICGAGGGGFCLGLTQDWAATQEELEAWKLLAV